MHARYNTIRAAKQGNSAVASTIVMLVVLILESHVTTHGILYEHSSSRKKVKGSDLRQGLRLSLYWLTLHSTAHWSISLADGL